MNERDLFIRAHQKESPEERRGFLAEACKGDEALRQRVEALLEVDLRAGGFLESPPLAPPGIFEPLSVVERAGTVVGPYKLLERIGEGGFGVVFMAEQQEPVRRKVALKVLKAGMDTRQVVARFEAERQALALMDHPNIAKFLDAGTIPFSIGDCRFSIEGRAEDALAAIGNRQSAIGNHGRPYFVMELVRGIPITEFCDQNHLPVRERLELFISVCQAVQHAHQKGIIHRDLKPSNVLVTRHDGTPVVKVIDFGIAKAIDQQLTDKTLFTNFAQMLGTPLYMSPEQAEMSGLDVDTRADIYALGVLLYELLTGTTPFDQRRLQAVAYDEFRRIIREEEPPKPSTRVSTLGQAASTVSANRKSDLKQLKRLFRGELDWIVMKALEKDRNRRYESASTFAADVQRYLAGEPVQAHPPSAWYRFRKFAGRKKGLLGGVGVVLLTLVAGIIGTSLALVEARAQYHHARQGEMQARQSEAEMKAVLKFFEKRVLSAARPKGQGQGLGRDATIRDALDQAEPGITQAFEGQPLAEASIRRVLGITYWYAGDYDKAILQHERALALREAHLGIHDPGTLDSMTSLGQAYQSRGRLTDALRLHERTLELRKAVLGPDHSETLWTMNRLADTLAAVGRPAEALPLYEEELQRARATLGPDHEDTLIYMDKLAGGYQDAGRFAEAVALYEETLKRYQSKLPKDHPDLLATMNNLGSMYANVGRWAESIALQREALELKKVALGPEHPETLINIYTLGCAYRDSGRPAEALPLLEESVRLHTAKMGHDHYITLIMAASLAVLYRDTDRLDEAAALFQETLRIHTAKQAADHPNRLALMNQLGTCLLKMKRYEEADALLQDCLALRTRKNAQEWWVGRTKSQLGQTLTSLKRYAEAEALLLEGYQELSARKDKMPARFHRYLADAARALADLYEAWGKNDEADRWRKQLEAQNAKG
jgi:serine/threonine protein kinase/tetratricopeptide (TPR) repeat protein